MFRVAESHQLHEKDHGTRLAVALTGTMIPSLWLCIQQWILICWIHFPNVATILQILCHCYFWHCTEVFFFFLAWFFTSTSGMRVYAVIPTCVVFARKQRKLYCTRVPIRPTLFVCVSLWPEHCNCVLEFKLFTNEYWDLATTGNKTTTFPVGGMCVLPRLVCVLVGC